MTLRKPLHLVLTAVAVIAFTHSVDAKKKKKGGGAAAPAEDAGGGMQFEPEQVERKDAEPTPPTPPPSTPANTGGGKAKQRAKPMSFSPESQAKPGVATKTLERALKLYDAEDYPMASIELNKVVEGQSGDDEATSSAPSSSWARRCST